MTDIRHSIREVFNERPECVVEASHTWMRSQITSLYPDVAKEMLWREVERAIDALGVGLEQAEVEVVVTHRREATYDEIAEAQRALREGNQ